MHHKVHQQKNTTSLLLGGFGLIELMVTISILILVMGIILTKHSSFNGAVLLRGQAFNVALAAREIQLTAVSVVGNSSSYKNVYGLHFDTSTTNNSIYKIFKDDGNYFYNSAAEEYGKQGKLDTRYKINDIRLDGISVGAGKLSVVFERPNFDAKFYTAANISSSASVAEIDICLRDSACTAGNLGEVRTVEITKTGQISVKN